ncbi:MAG: hypothetical protein GY884_08095, partial [Proteobacteria bacterium]|nr:hypothetical protein [Pseudomonadota bacterium]
DTDSDVNPDAEDVCDEVDNDCDGEVDDGATLSTWYADADADGFGDADDSLDDCAEPTGYVADDTDCDDTLADVNPDATEACNGTDDDCDGSTDEGVLGDGSACAAYDCGEVLDDDPSAGDGTYYVDLGTGTVVSTSCEMDIEGGGWTLLKSDVVDLMSSGPSREHLYTYGSGFYISPATTMVWSWSSYQALSGTYSYGTGTSATGTFSCTHAESGSWGIGCSNGGGGTYKCLTIYGSSASTGQGTVCQDQPDVFSVGACASNVYTWYREL